MPTLISREDAKAAGSKRFFDGEPCPRRGHVAERYVKIGNCVICAAEDHAKYQQDPKFRARQSDRCRQRQTGMPADVYHQKLIDQAGLCAICDQPMIGDGPGQGAMTDHDHYNPGVYRGLLCNPCNKALERVEEVPDWAGRAKAYLEGHIWTAP